LPVQSWVQRCCFGAGDDLPACLVLEPQTTCCKPLRGQSPVAAVVPTPVPGQPPAILEPRQTPAPPIINEGKSGTALPRSSKTTPAPFNGSGSSFRPPVGGPVPVQPVSPPAPAVKVDRIAFAPEARVDGQVMRLDRSHGQALRSCSSAPSGRPRTRP